MTEQEEAEAVVAGLRGRLLPGVRVRILRHPHAWITEDLGTIQRPSNYVAMWVVRRDDGGLYYNIDEADLERID